MDKQGYWLWLLLLTTARAVADAPMNYWYTHGPAADPVMHLNWGLTAISVGVSLLIGLLVLLAVLRRRPPMERDAQGRWPVTAPKGGVMWIYIGVGISTMVLLACAVWNAVTLSAVAAPAQPPAVEVEVTAHQWWWDVTYPGTPSSTSFETANEIHIPTGQPVRFKLNSADVIHSFWVPQLGGKTDVIPGQTNFTWLQADRPGVYRGQCGEYCGAQHAHMALNIEADSPADFERWKTAQAQPGPAGADAGQAVFMNRCSVCHRVRGSMAAGSLGPDLTHLMSRRTLAAGLFANDPSHLYAWVDDPPALKPGTRMPRVPLNPDELKNVVAYLQTLR